MAASSLAASLRAACRGNARPYLATAAQPAGSSARSTRARARSPPSGPTPVTFLRFDAYTWCFCDSISIIIRRVTELQNIPYPTLPGSISLKFLHRIATQRVSSPPRKYLECPSTERLRYATHISQKLLNAQTTGRTRDK